MKSACASEASMKMAFINLIPAIIYAAVITGQFMKNFSGGFRIGAGIVFVIVYMALTLIPYVSFVVGIASTIMYVGLLWALCDKVGATVVRIILKVVAAGFVGLLELSIAVNMTMKN